MPELSALIKSYKKELIETPQRAAVRMSDLVVLGTPFDTSSAQASWTPSIGTMRFGRVDLDGGSRYPQRSTVMAVARALKPGQTFNLGNGQPYIRRLEYGWSGQAPSGTLRRAAAQWQPVVDEAARGG